LSRVSWRLWVNSGPYLNASMALEMSRKIWRSEVSACWKCRQRTAGGCQGGAVFRTCPRSHALWLDGSVHAKSTALSEKSSASRFDRNLASRVSSADPRSVRLKPIGIFGGLKRRRIFSTSAEFRASLAGVLQPGLERDRIRSHSHDGGLTCRG